MLKVARAAREASRPALERERRAIGKVEGTGVRRDGEARDAVEPHRGVRIVANRARLAEVVTGTLEYERVVTPRFVGNAAPARDVHAPVGEGLVRKHELAIGRNPGA